MNLPATMSGVVLTGHGGPDMLQWRDDLPTPTPGPGDVVVRVGASAVNNTDINTRLAWYSKAGNAADDAAWNGVPIRFPRVQGIDACGTIAAIGPGVDAKRLGERVLIETCLRYADGQKLVEPWYLGSECDGGFAQYLRVDARHAFAINSPLSDAELASFPCSYSTAENMLTRAKIGAGERVLVTGASGGVGSAAIQLACARGAEVVAVTTAAKADALRALGAVDTLGRDEDPSAKFGVNSFDAVIDLVAGPAFPRLLDALRPGGRYAVAGAVAGAEVALDVRTLYLKDLTFFGCTSLDDGVFAQLIARIEAGDIRPAIGATLPLRDVAAAQALFAAKTHIGTIVMTVEAR